MRDALSILWTQYDHLDSLATEAERLGDEVKLERATRLLARCAQLIEELQSDHDSQWQLSTQS